MIKLIEPMVDAETIFLDSIEEDEVFILCKKTRYISIYPSQAAKKVLFFCKDGLKIKNAKNNEFLCHKKSGIIISYKGEIFIIEDNYIYGDPKTNFVRLGYDGSEDMSYANYSIDFNKKHNVGQGKNVHNFHMYSEILCNRECSGNLSGYYAHLDANPETCTRGKKIQSITLFKGIGTYEGAQAELENFYGVSCYLTLGDKSSGNIKNISIGYFGSILQGNVKTRIDMITGVHGYLNISKTYKNRRRIEYAIGVRSSIYNLSDSMIKSAYGLFISNDGGGIETYYGIYIKRWNGNGYSIYSDSDKPSYFGGRLEIEGGCIAVRAKVHGKGGVGIPICRKNGKLCYVNKRKHWARYSKDIVSAPASNPSVILGGLSGGRGGELICLSGIVYIKKGYPVSPDWIFLGYNSETEMEAWLMLPS